MERTSSLRHPTRAAVLAIVGVALLVLTSVTYGLSRVGLGAASVPVAMAIAVTKSVLIALFFMELKEQRGSHALVISVALFFVLLVLVLVVLEVRTRFAPTVPPGPFGAETLPGTTTEPRAAPPRRPPSPRTP